MKYTQYSSKKRGNSAFYIILAVCLLVIGVSAWFAFSNMAETPDTKPDSQNSNIDNNSNEYNSNNSSYNNGETNNGVIDEVLPNTVPSTPTAEETEGVPYQEPQTVKSFTMPVNGEILKDFSSDTLQYSATYGDMRIHSAVDITCKEGTLVSACSDGTVKSVEKTSTLGTVVTIDHGDGLTVKYASLKDVKVKEGDKIKLSDTLGAVTTVPSECSDQSHLHLEAYKNSSPISILTLFE